MRGLYLLAVTISFLVGSGLGVFFYTFAKYWVGAAGGFALGWFILALRKGGVVHSVGPRWAIIGSLTVVRSSARPLSRSASTASPALVSRRYVNGEEAKCQVPR
jgi:hypothetical protein